MRITVSLALRENVQYAVTGDLKKQNLYLRGGGGWGTSIDSESIIYCMYTSYIHISTIVLCMNRIAWTVELLI